MTRNLITVVTPCFNLNKDQDNLTQLAIQLKEFSFCSILVITDPHVSPAGFKQLGSLFDEVLVSPGASAGKARNIGTGLVKTDFVWFIDSDDEVVSSHLHDLARYLENRLGDIILCEHFRIDNDSNNKCSKESINGNLSLLENLHRDIGLWRMIFSISFIKKNDIRFVEGFGEDLIFVVSCSQHNPVMRYFPFPIYSYHVSMDSATYNQNYLSSVVKSLIEFDVLLEKGLKENSRQLKFLHARMLTSALLRSNWKNKRSIALYLLKSPRFLYRWMETLIYFARNKLALKIQGLK
jgi:hypothetical protein